jgi:hypothetical protein
MRTILRIALVLAGVLVSVMVPSKTITRSETQATNNHSGMAIYGPHVARPSNMKIFLMELVPVP